MKLVCPHCAKVIEVADSSAGQTTNCPMCQGPLTVPFAPPAAPASVPQAGPPALPSRLPPPPPPPPPPDPLAHTTAWTPTSGYVAPPLPSASKPAASGSSGGKGTDVVGRLKQFSLPESFHDWFGLGVLAALFLLFFFPWVSVSVGNTHLVDQNGLGVGFGFASTTKEGDFLTKNLGGDSLVMLAFLASIVGIVLLILILIDKRVQAPAVQNMKPTLQRIMALRDPIVLVCLTLITLVFLLHYVFMSFPLEQAAWSEKAGDTMITGLKLKIEGNIEKAITTEMVGMQWLQRRGWFCLSLLISLASTLWIGYRWMSARGMTKRWPKVVIQWPGNEFPQLTFDEPAKASDLTARSN